MNTMNTTRTTVAALAITVASALGVSACGAEPQRIAPTSKRVAPTDSSTSTTPPARTECPQHLACAQ